MTLNSPQGYRGGRKKPCHESGLDENFTPSPVTGSRKARKSSYNQQRSHQNQDSPLDTDRLMQEDRQEIEPLIVDGRDVLPSFDVIVFDRRIRTGHKAALLHTELRRIVDLQEKKAQAQIVRLQEDAQFAIADTQVIMATLRRQNHSLHEARSVLQKDNEGFQKTIENLRLELSRYLKENVEAVVNPGHEVERGFYNRLEQMTDSEIVRRILSLHERSRTLTLELQKRSHEHEFCLTLKPAEASGHKQKTSHEHESRVMLELGEANGHEQFNAISGSYTDDSATPSLLANVFNDTKTVVTRFQKELFKAFKSNERNPWDLLKSDQIVFARENHLGFYLKSFLNEMFFEGFENESFKIKNAVSRFLDPNLRQTKFYEYYQNRTGDIDDPHFREFWGAKYSSVWELFPLNNGNNSKVCCFEELGGFELGLQLALSFKEAARSVWLLHKLAFSFEPPASIFRVEQGVDVNPTYMDAIVKLEDDQRFVNKVGFMVTPGLRIRKTVMRCEVYLGGSADRGNSLLGHTESTGGKQHSGG